MPKASEIEAENRRDRDLLADMARKGGEIARQHYELNESKIWNKTNNSPVTDADMAVNAFLYKELISARPDYGWLSEETKDDGSRQTKRRIFVIDPIDGTRAFIKRLPHFVVSIAIVENGRPVAGALYNPLTEELFDAHKNGGATRNGKPITVGTCDRVEGCRMIGYDFKFKALNWPDMMCQPRNSMAYRMALVASGDADATVAFTPKSDWDLAAAEIIASEAGAIVTDKQGEPLLYNRAHTENDGVICSGPLLHPLLVENVKQGKIRNIPASPRD